MSLLPQEQKGSLIVGYDATKESLHPGSCNFGTPQPRFGPRDPPCLSVKLQLVANWI